MQNRTSCVLCVGTVCVWATPPFYTQYIRHGARRRVSHSYRHPRDTSSAHECNRAGRLISAIVYLTAAFLHTTFFYLFGREDDLEQQLCDAEREADGIGAVDEDVLGGHDAVDGPQQGVGAPVVRVRVRVTGPQQGVGAS